MFFKRDLALKCLSLFFCLITKNSFAHDGREISYSEISRALVNRYEPKLKEKEQQGKDQKKGEMRARDLRELIHHRPRAAARLPLLPLARPLGLVRVDLGRRVPYAT